MISATHRIPAAGCILLVIALLLPMTLSMAAGMYSWVDANGVKHYSDQPPPPKAKEAKRLKLAGSTEPAAEAAPADVAQPSAGQAMARAAGYEEQDIKRNCEIASKNLAALTSAPPLPEGSEAATTRQQSIAKAQSQVKLFCQ